MGYTPEQPESKPIGVRQKLLDEVLADLPEDGREQFTMLVSIANQLVNEIERGGRSFLPYHIDEYITLIRDKTDAIIFLCAGANRTGIMVVATMKGLFGNPITKQASQGNESPTPPAPPQGGASLN